MFPRGWSVGQSRHKGEEGSRREHDYRGSLRANRFLRAFHRRLHRFPPADVSYADAPDGVDPGPVDQIHEGAVLRQRAHYGALGLSSC